MPEVGWGWVEAELADYLNKTILSGKFSIRLAHRVDGTNLL